MRRALLTTLCCSLCWVGACRQAAEGPTTAPPLQPTIPAAKAASAPPAKPAEGKAGDYDKVADAAKSDDLATVTRLLDDGADVNARGGFGQTPLQSVAPHGSVEMATLLLDKGADINAQDSQKGWTPLHEAANWRNVEVVRLLLERGADTSIRAAHGESALDLAQGSLDKLIEQVGENDLAIVDIDEEIREIVEMLKAHGAR